MNMQPSAVETTSVPGVPQHLVIGGGGTKSILAGVGAFCGLKRNSASQWDSIGGISGGSIPAAFIALGLTPGELLRLSVRKDFQELLASRRHPWRVIRQYISQKGSKLPIKALMSSQPLGDFIDEMIPAWPERFWTMAMADIDKIGRCQIVFTSQGVFRYDLEGERVQLSNTPPSVGLAVRASCAIPGVISAVDFEGMHLFDGMLTWDGACPVGVVGKHYDAEAPHITAIDVGELDNWFGVIQKRYMRYWCGKVCVDSHLVFQSWLEKGVKLVSTPHFNNGAIKLDYSAKEKWKAIKAAYRAARDSNH